MACNCTSLRHPSELVSSDESPLSSENIEVFTTDPSLPKEVFKLQHKYYTIIIPFVSKSSGVTSGPARRDQKFP